MALTSIQQQKSNYRKLNASTYLLEYFGNIKINQLEGDEQERYREYRNEQGAAEGTINFEIQVFRSIYNAVKMRFACSRAKISYGDKILNKKGERIGIVFHCLRHTRASKWVEAGF